MRLLAGGLARWGQVSAFSPADAPIHAPGWTLPDLTGRLVELSASTATAHLTAACGLVLESQLRGDRAAWVTLDASAFYPPDLADNGIDLEAMPVVRASDERKAGRAADHLLRSGGFGLIVMDLASGDVPAAGSAGRLSGPMPHARRSMAPLPVPLLSRLLGLARQHDAVVLLLTKKTDDTPSLHSLVSLRAEARCQRRADGFELCVRVIKDKRGGPGWTHVETCRGPAGLR